MVRKRKESAGLLLFRRSGYGEVEVLLVHPGGPFWSKRDAGAWSIPKGMVNEDEDQLSAARREFAEETGHTPEGDAKPLGALRQPGGKWVHVWAIEGDWDPAALQSNTFTMEWPRKSGRVESFPEADRAAWFSLAVARAKILKGQALFLDRLVQALALPS
jgi:predicted NUDIX family NTP pyrophosphohydrolase